MNTSLSTEQGFVSFSLIGEEQQEDFIMSVMRVYENAVVNPKMWSEQKNDLAVLPTFPNAMNLQAPLSYFYLISVMKKETADLEVAEQLMAGRSFFVFQPEMKEALEKYGGSEFTHYREWFMEDIITVLNYLNLSYMLPYQEESSYNTTSPLIKNYYYNVPVVEVW